MSHLYPFTAPADRPLIMLIDLTQQATRCSDSSGQAQEYLIARHAAVETETVLVQICLELGAPSVICSLKECFQITDCLVYPMRNMLPSSPMSGQSGLTRSGAVFCS